MDPKRDEPFFDKPPEDIKCPSCGAKKWKRGFSLYDAEVSNYEDYICDNWVPEEDQTEELCYQKIWIREER